MEHMFSIIYVYTHIYIHIIYVNVLSVMYDAAMLHGDSDVS